MISTVFVHFTGAWRTMSASLAIELAEPDPARFAAERLLTGRVLSFVERTGIGRVLRERSEFSLAEASELLQARLRFALGDPVRARMVRVLLDLLAECGCLERLGDGRYCCAASGVGLIAMPAGAGDAPAGEGQIEFFDRCLDYADRFLRGQPPLFDFDAASAPAWDRLLGDGELARVRAILARLVLPRDGRPFDALVLCYGPGFDLVEIERRCPAARLTALDFTDAFRVRAWRRLKAPEKVAWVGPPAWGGFGRRVPAPDEAVDLVVFACADPYIPAASREFVFRDLLRVLRPGGVLGLLTHSYPDGSRRAVTDDWIRRGTFCHDFLESVCRGWQGFSDAVFLRRLFERVGFRIDVAACNSSVWRLSRPRASSAGQPAGGA